MPNAESAPGEHAFIVWLVETLHYPFDYSFTTPPPVDHDRLADYWNESDGWGISAEEARACVYEEAGLTRPLPPAESEHQHDRNGRMDRSICIICNSAYIECEGCSVYLCECGWTRPLPPACPSCGDPISPRYQQYGVCQNCHGTDDATRHLPPGGQSNG